jgi:serine/threonine protein kinase
MPMSARDLAPSSSRASVKEPHAGTPGLSARYRSLFVIGRGGMGTVEAALEVHPGGGEPGDDPREAGYERVVALKRLLPDSARDKRRVEMFLREAKLAKLLDHPNVVRAFDYGEIDGELFLAMEYVEGQALSRVLKALADGNGELGPALAAHVLAEVCEGLHAAHELKDESGQPLNLVHRDVSPQNVMVGYDGHVRLLDFGVAKIEAESVTKTGEVKGKTAYMSPEQAMGDALDRRSDLFGVGAVLFECLALRRMWGDGTDMDVIRKLALEKPPRLEDAVPGGATVPPAAALAGAAVRETAVPGAAAVPAALCALYTRLVAREVRERPATALEVAEELRALVPQGREEAARSLRRLLDAHFGDQAEEQRRHLTRSLEEVAPEQARELRESVSPDPAMPPSTRGAPRERASTASIADATGENPVSNGDAAHAGGRAATGVAGVDGLAAATRGSRPWPWLLGGALLLAGVGVWRATSGGNPDVAGPSPPPERSKMPLSSTATAKRSVMAPASEATAPAAVAASAPSVASVSASASSASASVPAIASVFAAPLTPAARPVSPRPAALASSPRAAASVSAKPVVSSPSPPSAQKPPPDVDDHPF